LFSWNTTTTATATSTDCTMATLVDAFSERIAPANGKRPTMSEVKTTAMSTPTGSRLPAALSRWARAVVAGGLVAADGVRIPVRSGGQQWLVSWHPPPGPPDGTPHSAEGVCVTPGDGIVVISPDGKLWDLPAGRPEPGETWEQTLRREMDEEACATVVRARLLGFTRGQCVAGPQCGRVLVRSVWRGRCRAPPVGSALRDRGPPRGRRVRGRGRAVARRASLRRADPASSPTPR
jgi:hypothetical protein